MNRLRITPSVIPNMFTAMNMFCGFLSIINAASGKFIYAAWLIIVAALFDALDGAMARLTKSSSELGVELDSLSDVVSFGAAPAFLIYSAYLFEYDVAGIIISSLLMIAGGFRLARFNVELTGYSKTHFVGLPIPSSGITISALILTYYNSSEKTFDEPYRYFIIPAVLVLSFLMVSRIRYQTFPPLTKKSLKENPVQFTFIFLALLSLILTSGKSLLYIFVLIILFGIFQHIIQSFKKKS